MSNWCSVNIEIKGSSEDVSRVNALLLNSAGQLDFEVLEPMPVELEGIYSTYNDQEIIFNKSNPNRIGLLKPSEFVVQLKELYLSTHDETGDADAIAAIMAQSPLIKPDQAIETSIELAVSDYLSTSTTENNKSQRFSDPTLSTLVAIIVRDNTLFCENTYGFAGINDWRMVKWGTRRNVDGEYALAETSLDGAACFSFQVAWQPPTEWFQNLLSVVDAMGDNRASIVMNYAEAGCFFGGSIGVDADGEMFETEYTDAEIIEFLGLDEDDEFMHEFQSEQDSGESH